MPRSTIEEVAALAGVSRSTVSRVVNGSTAVSPEALAAVQGAAIGAGLGLALAADFRVAAPEARFAANFTKLGYHPGFGLTVTLPRLVGAQRAALMILTSRRFKPEEVEGWGLTDQVVPLAELRSAALALAHEIAEKNPEPEGLAIVGIHTRGAILARRLHAILVELTATELPIGDLDISFYRDDVGAKSPASQPVVHSSHIDFDVSERTVVLVDDVLFTGRTVRAAIDALFDYGRPRRVQLAVLCDRGHRELPFRPDYVGKNLPTAREERVNVSLEESDGVDRVTISENRTAEALA